MWTVITVKVCPKILGVYTESLYVPTNIDILIWTHKEIKKPDYVSIKTKTTTYVLA